MGEEFLLVDGKIPVEDIEHLAFHSTNVPVLENTRISGPNHVLHHLIVEILASQHKCSDEDPLACPTVGGYPQVGLRSLNIDQSDEDNCDADSGRADHPPHELSECTVFFLAVARYAIKR